MDVVGVLLNSYVYNTLLLSIGNGQVFSAFTAHREMMEEDRTRTFTRREQLLRNYHTYKSGVIADLSTYASSKL